MSKSDLKYLVAMMKFNVCEKMNHGDVISREDLIEFLTSVEENHPTTEVSL